MNRPVRLGFAGLTAAGIATAVLLAGTAAPALAADSTPTPAHSSTAHPKTLAEIQTAAKARTDKRIASLTTAIGKVDVDKHLTDGDRATILKTLNADLAGMKSVEAKIAADTDVKTAAADYATIFTKYRVYAVALPQARIAAGADRATGSAIPKLTAAQKRLSDALAGKQKAKSTPELQADLADMTKQIDAATALVDGLSGKALAVTPADFNANHDVMKPLRADLKSAAADLKKAREDGKKVLAALHK